jgi:hypothetical protein
MALYRETAQAPPRIRDENFRVSPATPPRVVSLRWSSVDSLGRCLSDARRPALPALRRTLRQRRRVSLGDRSRLLRGDRLQPRIDAPSARRVRPRRGAGVQAVSLFVLPTLLWATSGMFAAAIVFTAWHVPLVHKRIRQWNDRNDRIRPYSCPGIYTVLECSALGPVMLMIIVLAISVILFFEPPGDDDDDDSTHGGLGST